MRLLYLLAHVAFSSASYVTGKAFDRFITIWLENQDFSAVSINPAIETLSKQGILLTEYYGLTHPSQPNYIASVGGDYFGLNHDGFVRIPENVSTIVDLFDTAGIEWRGYFEGVPGPGFMGEGSTANDGSGWDYVRKHNPFVSYDSINLNGTRLANLQSFDDFSKAVKSQKLPQYAHLSPNMLNDGHNTSLAYATNWTNSFLTPLLADPTFMANTLILLTYDESATYEVPNRIVSLLLGGAIPKALRGTKDNTLYTHYSILSTLENNWNLPNLGRYDVGANVFQFVAEQTGYPNHAAANISTIDNSVSYSGFLNSNPENWITIPPPNMQLVGAGGKGVLDAVVTGWAADGKVDTPYDGSGRDFDGRQGRQPVYKAQAPGPNITLNAIPAKATGAASSAPRGMVNFGTLGLAAGGVGLLFSCV